ncbi:hypothetical protein [Caballeronia sp. LZ035]|uniref:hypothetical protein n=1 Tax=Caballeronia sp. LZ035 TaxID=3038568 RepID=UPI0028590CC2|nr:hypothetical protein [Caballeronia sp. LZ035]MDR5757655.1 hypothetical protein [Caballeronia sp. LZ035]
MNRDSNTNLFSAPVDSFAPKFKHRLNSKDSEDTVIDAMTDALKNPAFEQKWGEVLRAKHPQLATKHANQQASDKLNGHTARAADSASYVADSAVSATVTGELAGTFAVNVPKAHMTASRKTRQVVMDGNFTPKGFEASAENDLESGHFAANGAWIPAEENNESESEAFLQEKAESTERKAQENHEAAMAVTPPGTNPAMAAINATLTGAQAGEVIAELAGKPLAEAEERRESVESMDGLMTKLARGMDALFAGLRARGGIPRTGVSVQRRGVTVKGIRAQDSASTAKAKLKAAMDAAEAQAAATGAEMTPIRTRWDSRLGQYVLAE